MGTLTIIGFDMNSGKDEPEELMLALSVVNREEEAQLSNGVR